MMINNTFETKKELNSQYWEKEVAIMRRDYNHRASEMLRDYNREVEEMHRRYNESTSKMHKEYQEFCNKVDSWYENTVHHALHDGQRVVDELFGEFF